MPYKIDMNKRESTHVVLFRDRYQVNDSPSPIDDLLNQTPEAVKCQELTAVLRNLRKTERRLQGELPRFCCSYDSILINIVTT